MGYAKYILAFFAILAVNDGVKVNMQGSLSLGKEVMDSLAYYVKKNYPAGRRSMTSFTRESDVLYLIIKSTNLCRDLDFCDGKLEQFVNEYITVMTKSIENIFEEILNQKDKVDEEIKIVKQLIFEEELKKCLREIRNMLREADSRSFRERDYNLWTEVIKKISIMFQTAAILFATERLDGNPKDLGEVKKKILYKFISATSMVEGKFHNKLCVDYDICIKSYECTKALDNLLGSFKDMEEVKVKSFIRYVSEALIESNFYKTLNDVTANGMQVILNDMAYADDVPTKDLLISIHKTVVDRLNSILTKTYSANAKDVVLVHAILSDMDHLYSKGKVDPFHSFLSAYYDWSRSGVKLGGAVRTVLKDIREKVTELPEDLELKLNNAVKMFLEITVEPERD